MPTFDPEIRRLAERLLIKPRPIDSRFIFFVVIVCMFDRIRRVGVFASEVTPGIPGVKPVTIKMIDAKTKEHVETLEVDACLVATGRVPNIAMMMNSPTLEINMSRCGHDEAYATQKHLVY